MYHNCAPGRYDGSSDTCFSENQLMKMAEAYNKYVTKQKLGVNKNKLFGGVDIIAIKNDKKYLLQEFKKRFEKVCGSDEMCLTRQAFMNEIVGEMMSDTFRPKGPHDPNEWLSTFDIDNIMTQYEKIYPKFKFMGAVPLNCDELHFCSLYKFDFENYYKNGIMHIATIFNLDRYGQPGSHWVALFIDIPKGEIYYCDSNGKPPIDNIFEIIKKFQQYYQSKNGRDVVFRYNNRSYQQDSSECGIYACNFIIRKLSGENFNDIISNALTFREINSCRNVYFNNRPSDHTPHPKCDP